MYKNIVLFLLIFVTGLTQVFAAKPHTECEGLPFCDSSSSGDDVAVSFIAKVISEAILYLSAIAVIALILSGFLYIFSGGEEEKTKKAKTWIIWSLVGVLLSISAWGIIQMLNNISVTLS